MVMDCIVASFSQSVSPGVEESRDQIQKFRSSFIQFEKSYSNAIILLLIFSILFSDFVLVASPDLDTHRSSETNDQKPRILVEHGIRLETRWFLDDVFSEYSLEEMSKHLTGRVW